MSAALVRVVRVCAAADAIVGLADRDKDDATFRRLEMLTGGSREFVMNIGKREVEVFLRDGLGKPQIGLQKGGRRVARPETSTFAEGNERLQIICILYSE